MKNLSTNVVPFLGLVIKAGFILLFIFITTFIKASYIPGIVINEVAWMGTSVSYSSEWIELYNNNNFEVNIDGWILKSIDGTPEINLTGVIPAKDFYLLEKTDDNTLPNITADKIYIGALSNKGEYLQLFDKENNLIDEINCSDGWFTGDNSTKQTMERKDSKSGGNDPENWQISENPGGTPKTQNSTKLAETRSLQAVTYPSGIVFSEILPSPEGPDDQEEWIEVLNKNNFEVDLSGWKISDSIGATNIYVFPDGIKIKAGEFLVLLRPTTKITLNNTGDGLNLIQPNDNLIDSVVYEKAPLGQSYNFTNSGWVWSDNLTPGTINNPVNSELQEDEKGNEIEERNKELASVGEQVFEEDFSFFDIFLIALVLAISSVIVVLLLKKMKKVDFF